MPARSKRRRAASLGTDLMLAPAVIALRLPLLAAETQGTNPFRVETVRAVSEKAAAVTEGLLAAQFAYAGAAWRFWPELLSGRVPSLIDGTAATQAMRVAMRPSERAVRSNHSRLSARR